MRTKTEVITPEWAIDILENHNPYNRKLSENTVQAYAADMRNGRWVLNHQGLAFDTNKNLCDGQHRLWAVVFSGKTIESLVTYDIPVSENKNGIELNSMDTIDRGRFRQTGQQMQLHGIKNGALTAARRVPVSARLRVAVFFGTSGYDKYFLCHTLIISYF